ncbi:MAG: PIN domain-containing protein [Rubrivivax sp.]|nr:PIN domain-containing protein [Rubrivivax sp.]
MNVFVDTNVVVHAHDRTDAVKCERARALLEAHARDGSLTVRTQVLQETYAVLIRKALVEPAKALFAVETLAASRVVGSNASFVLDALRLVQRHQLSLWDALIVQAALAASCTTLLTEDLQAGQRFGNLEVVDPFLDAVQSPRAHCARRPAAKVTGRRRR